jgi:hypothetical protein
MHQQPVQVWAYHHLQRALLREVAGVHIRVFSVELSLMLTGMTITARSYEFIKINSKY